MLSKVQKRLLANDLLVLLPSVHAIETEIQGHYKAQDREALSTALVQYARTCADIAVAVESTNVEDAEAFVEDLQAVSLMASRAKGEIASDATRGLDDVMKRTLTKLPVVANGAHKLTARLKRESGI
jgi:hypothetical protein